MKTRRSHTSHDRRQCESRPKYRASPYLPAGKQMGHLHPRPKKFGGTMNPPGQAENTATTTISWQMEPAMTRTKVDPHRSWPRLLAVGNYPCGTRPSQVSAPRNPVANLPSMESARSRLSPALGVAILTPKR